MGNSPGEIEADELAQAYERYGAALFRRSRKLLGHDDEAHEIVQEAFCQVWKNRKRFARRSSLFTFLYRVTTNLSIDRVRQKTRRGPSLSFDETWDGTARENRDSVAAARELSQRLAGLDEETVTIAVLNFVDGQTQDEIAAALGLSRRTVGKRLARFLAHARKVPDVAQERGSR